MRASVVTATPAFAPFTLTVTIETAAEARALYAIINTPFRNVRAVADAHNLGRPVTGPGRTSSVTVDQVLLALHSAAAATLVPIVEGGL